MTEYTPKRGGDDPTVNPGQAFDSQASLLESFYAQSQAGRWGLAREHFAAALERSSKKALTGTLTPLKVEKYLSALRLEDLALATACAEGMEAAWDHFYATYRPYLRSAAAAILRCPAGAPEACDLADSLFSDLYGVSTKGEGAERSLFRYFHGRSSLKTWLRAVLAQRHIDAIRAGRRFEELGEDQSGDGLPDALLGPPSRFVDPHRERYVALFTRALQGALDLLDPQEKDRLRLYYAEEKTLAEIGRVLGEHESSVSRHLDRVRNDLRNSVENILRQGFGAPNGSAVQPGLSDAEIALCFEYSAEDTPIDLDKLLPPSPPRGPAAGKRTR